MRRACSAFARLAGLLLACLPIACRPPAIPTPVAAPAATLVPAPMAPTTPAVPTASTGPAGLVLEEYAVVPQKEDSPTHLEFSRRLGQDVLGRRQTWRGSGLEARLPALNQALAPFGYRLAARQQSGGQPPTYDLYQGEKLVQPDLCAVGPLEVSASGKELALGAGDCQGQGFLIHRAGVERWDEAQHAYTRPVLVGEDLVTVERTARGGQFAVRRGSSTLYTTPTFTPRPDNPIKGLWSWQGHWVLEADGRVIIDGQDLNRQLSCDEVFAWQLIAGQPFYFFRRGSRISMSYAGQVLPQQYDQVIHYQCCEPAAFNVEGNGTMVWFYALRGGVWHYVEAGVYR